MPHEVIFVDTSMLASSPMLVSLVSPYEDYSIHLTLGWSDAWKIIQKFQYSELVLNSFFVRVLCIANAFLLNSSTLVYNGFANEIDMMIGDDMGDEKKRVERIMTLIHFSRQKNKNKKVGN